MSIHIFGIRHHGPGSARSLVQALQGLQPDLLLVEGPPDAEALVPLLGHADLKPPIAMLVYAEDEPRRAAFFPLARFSPEWQAIRFALEHSIPLRFMDLPQAHALALEPPSPPEQPEQPLDESTTPVTNADQPPTLLDMPWIDPLGALAAAAGYDDGERWWEHMVEQRRDGADLFPAVLEAMAALRAHTPADRDQREILREAWMRRTIRSATSEGFQRIAVVCGAWHAPALAEPGDAASDERALKGLARRKTAVTLTPWTYGRLASASGYGAGVASPGWYDHLWEMTSTGLTPSVVTTRWMTRAARLLRDEDLEISSAHVIEGVRLAEALASLRGLALPGLQELDEACRAVYCFGGDTPMQLIRTRLTIGEQLGSVPDDAPLAPLQRDLQAEQRRLRLAAEATWRDLELDLRKPNDRDRSFLLRRLNLIGVPWGALRERGGTGTFKEAWRIEWQPEFAVVLVEASAWGTTLVSAATARACDSAAKCDDLPGLVAIVNQALLAGLPDAIQQLIGLLQSRSAQTSDVGQLMDALVAEDRQTRSSLIGSLRYGDVRQTDAALIGHVVDGLIARICVGLVPACAALNDDAAQAMLNRLIAVDGAIGVLEREQQRQEWHAVLARLADSPALHGLIAGRACRLLLDAGTLSADQVARRMGLALSLATEPAAAAAWVEGLLRESGLLLVHDDALWALIDGWVSGLSVEAFQAVLPLLRRTFSTFAAPERRNLGERASRGPALPADRVRIVQDDLDLERALAVLPLVAAMLGVKL